MKQFFAAAVLVAGYAFSLPAFAAGAIAVGEPADVAKEGYSSGIAYGFKSATEAEDRALQECRTSEDATPQTRALCKLVNSFSNQCVVVALDPEAGTPGAGWAVAETLASARQNALQRCQETAGVARRGECRVTAEGCDGKAK